MSVFAVKLEVRRSRHVPVDIYMRRAREVRDTGHVFQATQRVLPELSKLRIQRSVGFSLSGERFLEQRMSGTAA